MTDKTKTKTSRAKPAPAPTKTGYVDRFLESLALLCGGKTPPRQLVIDWETDEGEELQDWAACNAAVPWATGIGTIEAAQAMASTPEEGMDHELREDAFPREPSVPVTTCTADFMREMSAAFGQEWDLQLSADGFGNLDLPDGKVYFQPGGLDEAIHKEFHGEG